MAHNNMSVRKMDFFYWLVSLIPRTVVYFCFMSVMAHSTTGKYGDTEVPQLSGMDAIERYGNDHNI